MGCPLRVVAIRLALPDHTTSFLVVNFIMASIWITQPDLQILNASTQNTAVSALGIELTAFGENWIQGRMPVDQRTRQPVGLLHGGASVVFAETLGSAGANLCVDRNEHYCVGLDINANHIRGVASGWVIGTAEAMHIGRTTQVWAIRIEDEAGKLVCLSRLTMAVTARPR